MHWLGLSSWRWLLILEGIPAVGCGVLTYFLLPSRLAEVGKGAFHPENDARAWVRFNLIAHFRQASWLLQRSRMTQRVWNELEQLLKRKRMNDRALPTIVDAAFGYRIRRSHYMNAAEVSEQVASGDLKLLVDHGLLIGKGETRGRVTTDEC